MSGPPSNNVLGVKTVKAAFLEEKVAKPAAAPEPALEPAPALAGGLHIGDAVRIRSEAVHRISRGVEGELRAVIGAMATVSTEPLAVHDVPLSCLQLRKDLKPAARVKPLRAVATRLGSALCRRRHL